MQFFIQIFSDIPYKEYTLKFAVLAQVLLYKYVMEIMNIITIDNSDHEENEETKKQFEYIKRKFTRTRLGGFIHQ